MWCSQKQYRGSSPYTISGVPLKFQFLRSFRIFLCTCFNSKIVHLYTYVRQMYTYLVTYSSVHVPWYMQLCTHSPVHIIVYTYSGAYSSVHPPWSIQQRTPNTLVYTVVYTYSGAYSSVHPPWSLEQCTPTLICTVAYTYPNRTVVYTYTRVLYTTLVHAVVYIQPNTYNSVHLPWYIQFCTPSLVRLWKQRENEKL